MRRKHETSGDEPGQDSFLDVVANMVGILIILVTVVGVRASQAPVDVPTAAVASPAPAEPPANRADEYRNTAFSLDSDIRRIDEETQRVKQNIAQRRREREQLATFVAAIKIEIGQRRSTLDANGQQVFDMNNQLTETQRQIDQLEREQADLALVRPSKVQVQNLPTPLSKTVHGKEVHLQLRGGRLTHIPLDRLLAAFEAEAKHKIWKLKDRNQLIDTVGPIDGFRMRYELGRFDVSLDEGVPGGGRVGSTIQLVEWELLPVSGTLGETVDVALAPNSLFRRVLAGLDANHDTLTVWTYPESFSDFRRVKAELHALGFPTAGRPLPDGQSIGGSPSGSRSAAQ